MLGHVLTFQMYAASHLPFCQFGRCEKDQPQDSRCHGNCSARRGRVRFRFLWIVDSLIAPLDGDVFCAIPSTSFCFAVYWPSKERKTHDASWSSSIWKFFFGTVNFRYRCWTSSTIAAAFWNILGIAWKKNHSTCSIGALRFSWWRYGASGHRRRPCPKKNKLWILKLGHSSKKLQ